VTTTYLPLLLAEIREAPALIGLVMMVNSAAGFAVPLLVGRWSDRRHTPRRGRRPFIAGGALLAACGLTAAALGHSTSFLVLTLAGAVAYVGVNVVTTAHRARPRLLRGGAVRARERCRRGRHARGWPGRARCRRTSHRRRLHSDVLLTPRRRFGPRNPGGGSDDRRHRELSLHVPPQRRGDARRSRPTRVRVEPSSRRRSNAVSALVIAGNETPRLRTVALDSPAWVSVGTYR
jgi:hypothetical protein